MPDDNKPNDIEAAEWTIQGNPRLSDEAIHALAELGSFFPTSLHYTPARSYTAIWRRCPRFSRRTKPRPRKRAM